MPGVVPDHSTMCLETSGQEGRGAGGHIWDDGPCAQVRGAGLQQAYLLLSEDCVLPWAAPPLPSFMLPPSQPFPRLSKSGLRRQRA